jgi:hypothetical protein
MNILEENEEKLTDELNCIFDNIKFELGNKENIFMLLYEFITLLFKPPKLLRRAFMGILKGNFWSYPWKEKHEV